MVVVGSRFYYDPMIASHGSAYQAMHPDHHQWLTERNIAFRTSNFVWPDMLGATLHNPISVCVCEVLVEIDDPEAATAFANYVSSDSSTLAGTRVRSAEQRSSI